MAEQPTEKTCTKCGETKPLEEYSKQRGGRLGLRSACKDCMRQHHREYNQRPDVRERSRRYREEHREELQRKKKRWHEANRDAIREKKQAYYRENAEAIRAKTRRWYRENQDKVKEYRESNREAIRERNRRWAEENVEYIRDYRKRAYELSAEERREYSRRYYQENREARLEYAARRHRENPHLSWADNFRWRTRRYGLPPAIEDFTKDDVIAKYGDHCAYCETGEFEELEHYIPVKAGGPHTLENVRPSCRSCNRAKSDADPEEWLAEQAEWDALTEDEQNALIDAEIAKYLNEEDPQEETP